MFVELPLPEELLLLEESPLDELPLFWLALGESVFSKLSSEVESSLEELSL